LPRFDLPQPVVNAVYGREQNVWISGEMERVLVQLSSQQN
jgi:hypothetical protein